MTQGTVRREKEAIREAKERYSRARQRSSEEIYDSPEFWDAFKAVLDAEDHLRGLQFRKWTRHTSAEVTEFLEAQEQYLRLKERRAMQREAASRRKERYQKRAELLSYPKIDNLLTMRAAYASLFFNTLLKKTSRSNQASFVGSLKQAYGQHHAKHGLQYFDCVAGTWRDRARFVAAHIFPLSFGQSTMEHIFGKDFPNEINTYRNGLLLNAFVEKYFDTHQLVIVPCDPSKRPVKDFKFMLIDHSGLKDVEATVGMTFGELDNRKLLFHTTARPRARYLYFHFIIAMVKLYKATKQSGIVKSEILDARMLELSKAWGSDGSYLSDNIIRGFIEEAGHDIPEEVRDNLLSSSSEVLAPKDEIQSMCDSLRDIDLVSDDDDKDKNADDSDEEAELELWADDSDEEAELELWSDDDDDS